MLADVCKKKKKEEDCWDDSRMKGDWKAIRTNIVTRDRPEEREKIEIRSSIHQDYVQD